MIPFVSQNSKKKTKKKTKQQEKTMGDQSIFEADHCSPKQYQPVLITGSIYCFNYLGCVSVVLIEIKFNCYLLPTIPMEGWVEFMVSLQINFGIERGPVIVCLAYCHKDFKS